MRKSKKKENIDNTFGSLLMMGLKTVFGFSILGRLSRGQLWIADMMLRVGVSFVLLLDLALFKIPALAFVFLLLGLIKTISLMVQRLNDLNLDQRWLLARLGVVIFCLLVGHLATYILLLICLLGLEIYLYAVMGEEGENDYGKDPLDIQPESDEKYYIIVGTLIVLFLALGSIVLFFQGGMEYLLGSEGNSQ